MSLRYVVSIFAIFGKGWKAASRTIGGGRCSGGSKLAKLPLALAIGNVGWLGAGAR